MTTQAVTDIKELMGEMPGEPCEMPDIFELPACDRQAAWACRVHWSHYWTHSCELVVIALCEFHRAELLAVAATNTDRCALCGYTIASALRVMPL